MRKKGILSLVMAVLMMVMASSAFAAEKYTTEIEALCMIPDVEVVVPADMDTYINPQKIEVSVGGQIEDGEILSTPLWIKNESLAPLRVDVSIRGKIYRRSKMEFAGSSTKGKDLIDKSAFVYFEMQSANARNWSLSEDFWDSSWDSSWSSQYNADKHIIVSESTEERENIVTLAAKDKGNSFGVFRLAGDCVQEPSSSWNSRDGFDVEVIFTFTPLPVI